MELKESIFIQTVQKATKYGKWQDTISAFLPKQQSKYKVVNKRLNLS